jgi:hypothetical protein
MTEAKISKAEDVKMQTVWLWQSGRVKEMFSSSQQNLKMLCLTHMIKEVKQ